jgi:organic radical activating enzyme
MKLRLAETFTSLQGEGHLAGKRMYFIRFAGCSVNSCPMHPVNGNTCDTDWKSRQVVEDISAVADKALGVVGVGGWVSITGGEPTDQVDAFNFLSGEIRARGMQLNIQTAGTKIVTCPWDWLTMSPKANRSSIKQDFGQELKLVYTGQTADELDEWYMTTKFWNYYLMPFWGPAGPNTTDTIAAIHAAYERGYRWELTTQQHKFWGVR